MNGEQLIDKICQKLREKDIRTYDSNIVNELRNLTQNQLSQLVNLGDIDTWRNERINQNKS